MSSARPVIVGAVISKTLLLAAVVVAMTDV